MARVIQADADYFNNALYGAPQASTVGFIRNAVEQNMNYLTDSGRSFMASAQERVEEVYNSEALRKARAMSRRVRTMWGADEIRTLETIGDIQNAPQTMLRWLAAEPEFATRYNNQTVDGWGKRFTPEPNLKVGEESYEYRRATDGIAMEDENGEFVATSYFESYMHEDDELDIDQQVDILRTWEIMKAHLRKGKEDPTSPTNQML